MTFINKLIASQLLKIIFAISATVLIFFPYAAKSEEKTGLHRAQYIAALNTIIVTHYVCGENKINEDPKDSVIYYYFLAFEAMNAKFDAEKFSNEASRFICEEGRVKIMS